MRKFDKLYNLIMEQIDSNRKPIRKVNAMTPKEFIAFLKEFLPYVKNGKVDLNDIRITQKIDGAAIALSWINNDMYFESSYSGITTYDKLPFPDAGKFLYETYRLIFKEIGEQFGDFKIKGELIWINGMEENGKVTPVGASYLTEKFGKFGGIVVFEIFKIENNQLIKFPIEDEEIIMEMIQDMNTDEFSFYLSQDIILNQNVNFTLDPTELLNVINNPDYNKERFSKTKDAQLIEEIQKIQADVVKQLSDIVDKSKGAFSAEEDLIEGIVLKINNSGNQYGIFSDGYKDMKHKYWENFEEVKPLYTEFLKKIFGYSQTRYIKLHWDEIDKEAAQQTLDTIKDEYIVKMKSLIDKIQTSKIPSSVKNTQLSMATKTLDKIKRLNSVDEFKKNFQE